MELSKYDIMLIGVNRDNYSQIEHLTQITSRAKDYLMSNQGACAIPIHGIFLERMNAQGSNTPLHIIYLPEVGVKALPIKDVNPLYKFNLSENTFEINKNFLSGVDKFTPALPDLSITSELGKDEISSYEQVSNGLIIRRYMPLPEPKVVNCAHTLEGLMEGVRHANDQYKNHCKGTIRELFPSPETLKYY